MSKDLEPIDILIKTRLGFERIVASRVKELEPGIKVVPAPLGFLGLITISNSRDKYHLAQLIKEHVLEAEKVIIVEKTTKADPYIIAKEAAKLASSKITPNETFAVRTTRRGKHNFTSIDVNIVVGDAVRRETNATVNLKYPDKIVLVEIIRDIALISIIPGSEEYKKLRPGKHPIYNIFRKMAVIQMPYLGPLDAVKVMGTRIGREVQNFEIKELVIAPIGAIDAIQLKTFIEGVIEGIESRYEIQRKSYGRGVQKVKVLIQDLYQLVRDRSNEVIIVFEPEGEPISRLTNELEELIIKSRKRVNLLFGSREGIPLGIYRHADLVVDLAPGVTLSTDYAAAAALIAISTLLYDRVGGSIEGINSSSR